LLEQVPHQAFHQRLDLPLIQEGGLDIQLREFGLPIGAQVLIAKTAHDLVVAIEPRNHQQLLVDLRRLRQGKELSRVRAARHQVVARTLRRRLRQHGRFDVDEAGVIQIMPHRASDAMTQQQALAHLFATQIDVAKPQAHFFTDGFIQLKRQRLRAIQDFQFLTQQLDLTGFEVDVGRAGRPRPHQTRDLEHVFIAYALRHREHRCTIGIEHNLQQPRAIPQIDENDAAMVAPTMRPAGHRDHLADHRLADFTAIMSAHKLELPKGKRAMLRPGTRAGKDWFSADARLNRPDGRFERPRRG